MQIWDMERSVSERGLRQSKGPLDRPANEAM